MSLHPILQWAQRPDLVLITVPLQDATNVTVTIKDTLSIEFESEGKKYAASLTLFDEVVPEESSHVVQPRKIELKLQKKNTDAEYWPRLTKEKVKNSNIQIDWNRWVDEDEVKEGENLGDFGMGGGMPGMGGMGGGMPGMGGMGGGMGGMGGMDMQQLLAQMGGMGGMDFGGAAGQEHMDEDALAGGYGEEKEEEEMPPLEDH